jgi:hypothetical protein
MPADGRWEFNSAFKELIKRWYVVIWKLDVTVGDGDINAICP